MAASVLIYVADKPTALANVHRVLRPGGRLALFEPIYRFGWPGSDHQMWGCDVTGLEPLARRVKDTYRQEAPPTETYGRFRGA
ncbi:MAG TPA: methyltransferase domain-containing protein [Pseudonocardiaceae bacterium]|jgi:ubiquinone/menaquinone biosynthesis C-methylase UbiE|nr:methyltransferase domain-containing protein [Pseudonocardiaceae bacterium]